jgi:2-oxoglutarate dehydrogenase E1 component
VLTPKGYLRRPEASSPVEEFAAGRFQPVLSDPISTATSVLVASGKVVHELRAERERRNRAAAIVSLERLYPFPEEELARELARHGTAREIVWVQEEPANMGALGYVWPWLERLAGGRGLRSVKRSASASPSTGSAKAHGLEQAALLGFALADLGRRETRDSA